MSDTRHSGPFSVTLTETVTKGMCMILGTYPAAVVSTGDTVYPLGTALSDGVSGETILVEPMGNGKIVIGLGTATAGSPIAPSSSGSYQVCASGDRMCGLAIDSATAAEFRFLNCGVSGGLLA